MCHVNTITMRLVDVLDVASQKAAGSMELLLLTVGGLRQKVNPRQVDARLKPALPRLGILSRTSVPKPVKEVILFRRLLLLPFG